MKPTVFIQALTEEHAASDKVKVNKKTMISECNKFLVWRAHNRDPKLTTAEIAEQLDLSSTTVSTCLRSLGVKLAHSNTTQGVDMDRTTYRELKF